MAESKVPGHIAYDLDSKAEDRPDFNVVTFENGEYPEEVLTYADIVIKGRKIARRLQEIGIGKGDAFALVMKNHPEFIYSLYAATVIGAILLPIDPRTKGERLKYVLSDSKSKGILFSSEFMDSVTESLTALRNIEVVGVTYKAGVDVPMTDKYPNMTEILAGSEVPPPDRRNDVLDAPIEIIYTSGTTGDPKGVVLKGARLALFSQLAKFVWQYSPEDTLYTGLSLAHGNAQAVTLIPSLLLSIPSIFSRTFTKSRIWDICREYGCTTFSLLGGMMMAIYSEPKKPYDADNPVRLVLSAGTPRDIWVSFENRFNVLIHEWYGAIEGGFAHKPPHVGPVGSFGKPLEGLMEMKVVRDDGTESEPGELGELICRTVGQPTEVEYLGKKEASKQKTRGGWLRTGDKCHRDENGWFFFDYREGGGLRRSGDFIMPQHVEAVLAEHPQVTDVCVYGIPATSGAPGESDIVAAVVPVAGGEIDPESVFRLCVEKLSGNFVPSYLQVVSEIPKTVSEKNLDRLLMEIFQKQGDNVYRFEDFR
ncbi:MAG: AMP-binding protein [Desulfomonilaceae bacterium]